VLTNRSAKTPSASWPAAFVGVAIILSLVTLRPAHAGSVVDLNCVGPVMSPNCVGQWALGAGDPYVRTVPDALGEEEKAEVSARDRKWLAHCRPLIMRDDYGVARYRYAAPGCEFGVGGD
jgi:hypothetical protein